MIRGLQHVAFKGTLTEMELVLVKISRIKRKYVIAEIQLNLNEISQFLRIVKYKKC